MGRGTVWFLGAEAALYAGFLALDLAGTGGGWSLALKYSGIALCLLSALQGAFSPLYCTCPLFSTIISRLLLCRREFSAKAMAHWPGPWYTVGTLYLICKEASNESAVKRRQRGLRSGGRGR